MNHIRVLDGRLELTDKIAVRLRHRSHQIREPLIRRIPLGLGELVPVAP